MLASFLFLSAMVMVILADTVSMTIPNRLVGVVVGAFCVLAWSAGLPLTSVGWHLATGLGVLALTFGAFALGWMGGGDAKLIAATALWFGPSAALIDYIFLASLFGGVLTIAIMLARAVMRPTTGHASLDRLLDAKSGIPYGVALGAAGILVCLDAPEMQAFLAAI